MTIATDSGFVVGKQYQVVDAEDYRYGVHTLAKGDILTMTQDDGTSVPYFTKKDGSVLACRLHRLIPVPFNENTDFSIDQIGGATTIRVQRELTSAELQAIVKILKGN